MTELKPCPFCGNGRNLGMANEKRLIDAKAGKKAFLAIAQPAEYRGVIHMVVPISEIDKLPTVDAVEVVRCKDCIHWCDCKVKMADGTYRDYLPGEAFCDVTIDKGINVSSHCTLHGYEDSIGSWFWARPDDFCSRGERRKDA